MVISSIVRHVSGPVESWFQLPHKIDQVADIKLRSRCSYRMILLPYSSGACWKHYSHHIAHSVFVRCLETMLRRLVNTRHTQLSWRSTTHNLLWMSLSIDKFDPMRYTQYYYCCYRLPKMSIVQRHIIDQLKISVFYLCWMFCRIHTFVCFIWWWNRNSTPHSRLRESTIYSKIHLELLILREFFNNNWNEEFCRKHASYLVPCMCLGQIRSIDHIWYHFCWRNQ